MGNSLNSFEQSAVIFKEGDTAKKLFIIKTGEVLCLKNFKGKLTPIFKAGKGDIVGESAMIEGAPFTYSAIALTSVEAVVLDAQDMHEVLKMSPGWLSNLTSTMVTRFNNTANLIAANRVHHASIIGEDEFTPAKEMEFKKILGQ
jgi:CRP-like cAMP-binding protein